MFAKKSPVWIQMFRVRETRRKLIATLSLLAVYRFLTHFPLPGVSPFDLEQVTAAQNSPELVSGIINLLTGGAFSRLSVLALGLLPYASANATIRGLFEIIPALEKMAKENPREANRKASLWVYYLVAPFAVLQAYLLFFHTSLDCSSNLITQPRFQFLSDPLSMITMLVCLTAGSYFVCWIAELINEFGFRGTGFNAIVFTGAALILPEELYKFWQAPQGGIAELSNSPGIPSLNIHWLSVGIYLAALLAAMFLMVYLLLGRRNIPIMFPARISIQQRNRPPRPVNFPIIMFPSLNAMLEVQGLLAFIILLIGWLTCSPLAFLQNMAKEIKLLLVPESAFSFLLLYIIFILFGPLLAEVEFMKNDYAHQLRVSGGTIPGIHSGADTEKYLLHVFRRLIIIPIFFGSYILFLPWLVGFALGLKSSLLAGEAIYLMISFVNDLKNTISADVKLHDYSSSLLTQ